MEVNSLKPFSRVEETNVFTYFAGVNFIDAETLGLWSLDGKVLEDNLQSITTLI